MQCSATDCPHEASNTYRGSNGKDYPACSTHYHLAKLVLAITQSKKENVSVDFNRVTAFMSGNDLIN